LRTDGAALLQLRDEKPKLRHAGKWVPPGGHAELEEQIEICAKREFLEETNYRCGDLYRLVEFKDVVAGWRSYELTVFWSLYDSIQELVCNEGQELRFISRHDADKYPIPSYLVNIWDSALEQANFKGLISNE
jgi:8-oxo-dGTP pyrophosphatase MutT (NUDIX family)